MSKRLVLMSPTEFPSRVLREESHCPHPGATLIWVPAPDFATYALGLRKKSNLSLRQAAKRIGVSHPFLANIERGKVERPLSVEFCERMSVAYREQLPRLFELAGIRYAVEDPSDEPIRNSIRDMLERLLTHERFGPTDFQLDEMRHISDRSAELMLALAQRVDWNARAKGPGVFEEVIDRPGGSR